MEWLCRPGKFEAIQYIGHDLFKVKNKNNKWGIISAGGKQILDTKCDSITPYLEGRALILDKSGHKY